ncbi:MAG: hypothetical protein H0W28_02355 [Pyrinomonadaceae bacterium]|nr:hypothetical protein [Pyrinomonadaceae bacterium]
MYLVETFFKPFLGGVFVDPDQFWFGRAIISGRRSDSHRRTHGGAIAATAGASSRAVSLPYFAADLPHLMNRYWC